VLSRWARSFGKDYTEQGSLFEELTAVCMRQMLLGWEVHSTGWTSTHPIKLKDVVNEVATKMHEPIGKVQRWTKAQANEAGLDLLCFRSFEDKRAGFPVYLVQCASGADYEDKLHTPNLKIWGRVVEFTAQPKKAFSMPFGLLDDEFIRVCNLVDGLLLDRYRLLAPGRTNTKWLPVALKTRIAKWTKSRIDTLPRYK
jgi:hypothetical protein